MDYRAHETKNTAVNIQKPSIIGAYSLNSDRKYQNDMSQLRYLKIPKVVDFDLKDGEFVEKDPNYDPMERIHQMSNFVMNNKDKILKMNRIDADFVCFRGLLNYVMASPYNKYNSWTIDAVKFKGTIYLCMKLDKNYGLKSNENFPSHGYGFKFERFVLSLDPHTGKEKSVGTVYENEEFCVVMSTSIDDEIKILFGMEIDGVDSENAVNSLDDLKKSKLVEVKTRKVNPKYNSVSPLVALSWWCQSYISDIENIYVGMRDEDLIKEIKVFSVERLEDQNKRHWLKNVCLNFVKSFLRDVKRDMKDVDDSHTIFRYEWNPSLHKKIKSTRLEGKNDFLSEEYIAFINNL